MSHEARGYWTEISGIMRSRADCTQPSFAGLHMIPKKILEGHASLYIAVL